jgi:hypothetical protein
MQRRALDQFKDLAELGASVREPDLGDPQLSFQLAQSIQDLDFQSVLLRNRSETERMKELNEFLSEYVPRQRYAQKMKERAGKNGFGGKLAGL